jgi:signal transduction histidine kinase/ActR/RegA family two-component response regulator
MKLALTRSLFGQTALSFVAVVAVPVLLLGSSGLWFAAREQRSALDDLLRTQSEASAQRIAGFVLGIQDQLAFVTQLPWDGGTDLSNYQMDAMRVLRQAPAITDLALLDGRGRERLSVSRLALDRLDSGAERGNERAFVEALSRHAFHGPVTFRRQTEPFMTLAVAGARREMGVAIAEVNLKFVWDVVNAIRVGRAGRSWVADDRGRLLAHPDMSYVLSNPDVAAQVQAMVKAIDTASARGEPGIVSGLRGERVQAAYALAQPMGWRVFVELPEAEAQAPLFTNARRALWVALGSGLLAVAAALLLARRLVRPIRALTESASKLGAGSLEHRIDLRTNQEIEALGRQFNAMAQALQASYAGLERKVAERTHALAEADAAKTRFVAAASHDLRQPLHAMNLLVAQLRLETDEARRQRVSERIESALDDINALFGGLLDISRLDAGTVRCEPRAVALAPVLERVRDAFAADAAMKGLRLRIARCGAWVTTDPQLLERILLNLVGNAVRHTPQGGILIVARERGGVVILQVRDSGVGIAPYEQQRIFDEYVQLGARPRLGGEGLGLGLAIVRRLARLLEHRLSLRSAVGKGSCFELRLPPAVPVAEPLRPVAHARGGMAGWQGRRVVVIDDDERVLESTSGLLQTWGCETVSAATATQALELLNGALPSLIIADLHLRNGELGIDAVTALRQRFGDQVLPAMLVSGDVGAEARESARDAGLHLLEKPVQPMALRALGTRLMAEQALSA